MSDELDELDATILDAATKPAEMSGDLGSVKHRSLKELEALRKRLATQDADAEPHLGLTFRKISPPGAP